MLTLGRFQEIYKISKSDLEDEEKMTEIVACMSGMTVAEAEALPYIDFNTKAREAKEILSANIPETKPKKQLAGWGITYEPANLTRGQYVTVQHFMSGDPIENAHLILASISYDLKTKKHQEDKHLEIAEKFQELDMADILPSCVFFCQLFAASMKGLQNFLARELKKKGKNPKAVASLINALGGIITQNRLQTSRV